MTSNKTTIYDNNKANEIKVNSVNKPTKEQGRQKIKELSEFLSKTWHMPTNSK